MDGWRSWDITGKGGGGVHGLVWSFSLAGLPDCLLWAWQGMAWLGVHVDGSEWVCYFLRFFLSAGCVSFSVGCLFSLTGCCVALRCVACVVWHGA